MKTVSCTLPKEVALAVVDVYLADRREALAARKRVFFGAEVDLGPVRLVPKSETSVRLTGEAAAVLYLLDLVGEDRPVLGLC